MNEHDSLAPATQSVMPSVRDPAITPPALPSVVTPLPPDQVVSRLLALAKRGELAGFRAPCPGGLFSVAAHGVPFDKVLVARARSDGGRTRLEFRARLKARVPAVAALGAALTIWPGVWLTDSMLRTYFPGYDFSTWMWYLPLSVLPLPFAARTAWRRTQRTTAEAIGRAIARIAAAVEGQTE